VYKSAGSKEDAETLRPLKASRAEDIPPRRGTLAKGG